MAKKTPEPLTLVDHVSSGDSLHSTSSPLSHGPRSPLSPASPKSPLSPFRRPNKLAQNLSRQQQALHSPDNQHPTSGSEITTPTLPPSSSSQQQLAPYPSSEPADETRPTTKGGFFSNYKALKSSKSLQPSKRTNTPPPAFADEPMSKGGDRRGLPDHNSSSSQDLSKQAQDKPSSSNKLTSRRQPRSNHQRSETSVSPSRNQDDAASIEKRRNRPKAFTLLNRAKTPRPEDEQHSPVAPAKASEPERMSPYPTNNTPKSAPPRPVDQERFQREMAPSTVRQRSEDRQPVRQRDTSRDHRDHGRGQPSFSTSLRENGGALMNMVKSGTKAADRFRGGFFKKSGRSNSTTAPEIDDEHYMLKVINLPLVEQTRITRIAKRLEESRDKTEFWMPSFPWRAIDYLNYRGSDAEGLYRVPGSKTDIKKWQRKFDEELDVDLLEQDDLYDVNIIGSMFKQWLRELPDELLPKAVQDKISRECAGAETVPQLLVDELCNLSPFNYYLLFAITCHLSLLISHSDKNKMTFNNLCICFQPCIKIDAFCFKFLVCDWQECWRGHCINEDAYLEQEYMVLDNLPSSAEGRSSLAVESHEERNISSSDSSKPSDMGTKSQRDHRPPNIPVSQFNDDFAESMSNSSQHLTANSKSNDLRPLSPIAPLSPLGM